MSLASENDAKRFLIDQVTAAGRECVTDHLEVQVDFLWNLMRAQAAGDLELHYLVVRGEILKSLIACAARSVDTRQTQIADDTYNQGKVRTEGYAQQRGTSHQISFSDSLGKQRFSELITYLRTSTSNQSGYGIRYDLRWQNFNDSGRGEQFGVQNSNRANTGYVDTQNKSDGRSLGLGEESKSGCRYTFSARRRGERGTAVTLGVVVGDAMMGITQGAGKGSWDFYFSQRANARNTDRSVTVADGHTHGGTDRVDDRITQFSRWFNSRADRISQGLAHTEDKDTATTGRDSRGHTEATGYNQREGRSRANARVQNRSQSHDESKADSQRHSSGRTDIETVKRSHLWKHLAEMYDENLNRLTHRQREIGAYSSQVRQMYGCYDIPPLACACGNPGRSSYVGY